MKPFTTFGFRLWDTEAILKLSMKITELLYYSTIWYLVLQKFIRPSYQYWLTCNIMIYGLHVTSWYMAYMYIVSWYIVFTHILPSCNVQYHLKYSKSILSQFFSHRHFGCHIISCYHQCIHVHVVSTRIVNLHQELFIQTDRHMLWNTDKLVLLT